MKTGNCEAVIGKYGVRCRKPTSTLYEFKHPYDIIWLCDSCLQQIMFDQVQARLDGTGVNQFELIEDEARKSRLRR